MQNESVPDLGEIIEIIEGWVLDQGNVTYDQLLSLLPEAEEHIELLDSILDELISLGVTVVDAEGANNAVSDQEPENESSVGKPVEPTVDLDRIPANDLLSIYLTEMSQEPLLTHDQEINLAREIAIGRQAERVMRNTDYTSRKYARLQAQVEAGQAARERLGRANTRLVVSIAKRFRGAGIPFTDLIQSGNIGLMRAVDRYDPNTGNRFSTYATWWIRQAVTRALANQGRIIRIPVHTGDRMRAMARVSQRLEKERGERPTPEEIAVEMDESPVKVRQLMRWAIRPMSLEQPVGKERDTELSHFIIDEDVIQPEEVTDANLLSQTLEDLLNSLTPREARVLRLRYGLQDGQTRTLRQVAEKFGLSRERVRQIEQEALTKMRMAAPDYKLQHFLLDS